MNKDMSEDNQAEDSTSSEINHLVTRHLEKQVTGIDTSISQRLHAARRHAVQQQALADQRGPLHFGGQLRMPLATAFSCASAMVLALLLWQVNPSIESPLVAETGNILTLENTPVLSASDDLEFFGSIDFLVWMENDTG